MHRTSDKPRWLSHESWPPVQSTGTSPQPVHLQLYVRTLRERHRNGLYSLSNISDTPLCCLCWWMWFRSCRERGMDDNPSPVSVISSPSSEHQTEREVQFSEHVRHSTSGPGGSAPQVAINIRLHTDMLGDHGNKTDCQIRPRGQSPGSEVDLSVDIQVGLGTPWQLITNW